MKTLITQPHPELRQIVFSQEATDRLSILSDVDWAAPGETYTAPDLPEVISQYDVVLSGWRSPKLTKEILDKAGKLKFIGHAAGTVIPFVDIDVYDRDVRIVNANRPLAESTAECAFALMMSALWKILPYAENARKGIWSDNDHEVVPGLQNQVVGIVGLGLISRRLIQMMRPFNTHVLLYSHYCSDEEAKALGIEKCSLEELCQKSQIVSIHSTLTERTRGMIGQKELAMLQDGALLVNTARAPIVDEDALIRELQSGRISAAMDVFNEEPLSTDHPFFKLPNVTAIPHIGGFSSYWKTRLGLTVIEDLERFIKGEPLQGEITREQFLRQTPK